MHNIVDLLIAGGIGAVIGGGIIFIIARFVIHYIIGSMEERKDEIDRRQNGNHH